MKEEHIDLVLIGLQSAELDRARIFEFDADSRVFTCIASVESPGRDAYRGVSVSIDNNPYARDTAERFLTAPGARKYDPRDPTMFGPDPDATVLGKPSSQPWLIVPIVVGNQLHGQIAADNAVSGREITSETIHWLDLLGALLSQAIDTDRKEEAQKNLRTSEALYYSLVENLPMNLFRKDCDGRFTYVNRKFCETLGKSRDEILDKKDSDLYTPEVAAKYRQDDERVGLLGRPDQCIEQLVQRSGEERFVEVVKIPLFDSNGKLSGIQGLFWDVTARQAASDTLTRHNEDLERVIEQRRSDLLRAYEQLRDSEAKYREICESASDVIYTHDLERRITEINKSAEKILGYSREELLKLRMDQIISLESGVRLKKALNEMLTGKVLEEAKATFEMVLVTKRAARVRLEVILKLIVRAGVPVGVRGIARDVTEERMRVELDKLQSIRSIAEHMAHEVKNPLAIIRVQIDRLPKILAKRESTTACINAINKHIDRAVQIITELRAYAEESPFEPQSVNINSIIRTQLEANSLRFEQHSVVYALDLDDAVSSLLLDKGKVEEIFDNLINNALDAVPRNGALNISSRQDALNGWVVVTIENDGAHIPPDKLSRIFEPYVTTKREPGRGLGLSIVKKYMTMHRGTIDIFNRENGGVLVSLVFK